MKWRTKDEEKIALVLALTLILSVIVLSVLAAQESLHAHICPRCGETAYDDEIDRSMYYIYEVPNCFSCLTTHKHRVNQMRLYAYCSYCMYEWLVYNEDVDICLMPR